jgi:2-polyprenyl-3-methyl-5-hydroxy-6-metoxy-1,4-benzoquinol methylase
MNIRSMATERFGGRLAQVMRNVNGRHPWSHNDAFHPWIATKLPPRRHLALDVGCGRGELLAALATQFEHVHGTDADARMRETAMAGCAGLPNVTVADEDLNAIGDGYADLVTMIAVLHHLNLPEALDAVHRVVRPGGRFLCVGLARPVSVIDHAWDLASMVTNPIIGYVRHPWTALQTPDPAPFPVAEPRLTFNEIRAAVQQKLPGATMQHSLGFHHIIVWTKPES